MRKVIALAAVVATAAAMLAGCAGKDTAAEADKAYKGPGATKAGAPSANPGNVGPVGK